MANGSTLESIAEVVISRYQNGESAREIAESLGYASKTSIYNLLERHGVPRRTQSKTFVPCLVCGAPVHLIPSRAAQSRCKYCSVECRSKAQSEDRAGKALKSRVSKVCPNCGTTFKTRPSNPKRYCSVECRNEHQRGQLSSAYMGGTIQKDGYRVIPDPRIKHGKRQIPEHRYLMEQHLGRLLSPDEVVHHINNNKLDNRIENLTVMSRVEHARLHNPGGLVAALVEENRMLRERLSVLEEADA